MRSQIPEKISRKNIRTAYKKVSPYIKIQFLNNFLSDKIGSMKKYADLMDTEEAINLIKGSLNL